MYKMMYFQLQLHNDLKRYVFVISHFLLSASLMNVHVIHHALWNSDATYTRTYSVAHTTLSHIMGCEVYTKARKNMEEKGTLLFAQNSVYKVVKRSKLSCPDLESAIRIKPFVFSYVTESLWASIVIPQMPPTHLSSWLTEWALWGRNTKGSSLTIPTTERHS